MFMDDDNRATPKADVVIGQDLSILSVSELEQRIRILEGEIERTREDIAQKSGHLLAAESVFSRK